MAKTTPPTPSTLAYWQAPFSVTADLAIESGHTFHEAAVLLASIGRRLKAKTEAEVITAYHQITA